MTLRRTMTFTVARRRLVIVLILVLWGFGTHGTHAGSGDEPHYLAIAHSIAFDGDLDVGNNYLANEPLIMSGTLQPEVHIRPGANGTLRPVHDVGLPLIIAPYVRVAAPLTSWLSAHLPAWALQKARLSPTTLYRHFLGFAMIALAAVLAVMMFDVFVALGASPGQAFWFTLLLMASPPLLAYSTLLFTEIVSALLAFLVFSRVAVHNVTGRAAWLTLGAVTGFLLILHVRNVGLVVGLSLVAALRWRQTAGWGHASAFAVGLAAMLVVRGVLNHHFWGTWIATPHAAPGVWPGWTEGLRVSGMRLVGLLVDQEYGVLVYAPVYLLALAGLPAMCKQAPRITVAALLIAVSYLLPVLCPLTNIHGWTGQWCPAGRFMTPVLPLLGLGVYFAFSSFRTIAAAVIVVQILMSAYFWQHPKLLWNTGDGEAAFCSRVGMAVCERLPALAPTVH